MRTCEFVNLVDNIWGRCARLHKGAEEQVQVQEVLCQTPSAWLSACPDRAGRGQLRDVSSILVREHLLLFIFNANNTKQITWHQRDLCPGEMFNSETGKLGLQQQFICLTFLL